VRRVDVAVAVAGGRHGRRTLRETCQGHVRIQDRKQSPKLSLCPSLRAIYGDALVRSFLVRRGAANCAHRDRTTFLEPHADGLDPRAARVTVHLRDLPRVPWPEVSCSGLCAHNLAPAHGVTSVPPANPARLAPREESA
jgi:hypothetical protein